MTPLDESGLAAILPSRLADLVVQVRQLRAMAGMPELRSEAPQRTRPPAVENIQIIDIQGVITQRQNMWTDITGGTSLDAVSLQLAMAAADPNIHAVVLNINSPGGGVYGVDETAQQIADLNKRKPVIAFANGMAASAAYWLASSAAQIVATPSSELGSIGVFAVHFDESGYLAKEGIVPTVIKAGKHKAEANPYQALTDEDRDAMASRIESHYQRFLARVAKGRGVSARAVETTYGEGRVLTAAQAESVGMANVIGGWIDVLRMATSEARARTQQQHTQQQPRPRVAADALLHLALQIEQLAL